MRRGRHPRGDRVGPRHPVRRDGRDRVAVPLRPAMDELPGPGRHGFSARGERGSKLDPAPHRPRRRGRVGRRRDPPPPDPGVARVPMHAVALRCARGGSRARRRARRAGRRRGNAGRALRPAAFRGRPGPTTSGPACARRFDPAASGACSPRATRTAGRRGRGRGRDSLPATHRGGDGVRAHRRATACPRRVAPGSAPRAVAGRCPVPVAAGARHGGPLCPAGDGAHEPTPATRGRGGRRCRTRKRPNCAAKSSP